MEDLTEALEILKSGQPEGMSQEQRDKLINGITQYLAIQQKEIKNSNDFYAMSDLLDGLQKLCRDIKEAPIRLRDDLNVTVTSLSEISVRLQEFQDQMREFFDTLSGKAR